MTITTTFADIGRDAFARFASLAIRAYYDDDNPSGGNLHIVTDDFNLEDSSVEFCIEAAVTEGDKAAEAIGLILLAMPMEWRALAIYPEKCQSCGHSMCLHTLWFEGGFSGASCAGPCALEGCGCAEAVRPA